MILDESPSEKEDMRGKPYLSKSMTELMGIAEGVGLDPEEFFIGHTVSCRPPDKKAPTKGEIAKCAYWVKKQIDHVQPEVVVLVGNSALQSITGAPGIAKRQGRPFKKDGIIYLPILSPGVMYHDPSTRHQFERNFELVKSILETGGIPREKKLSPHVVWDWGSVHRMMESLEGYISFDIETNCLYPWQTLDDKGVLDPAKITMIGFGTSNGEFSIPFSLEDSPWGREDQRKLVQLIDTHLAKRRVKLITHSGKFDFLWMMVHHNVRWQEHLSFDTMIAHYLIDENSRHGLKGLAQKYLGAPDWDIDKESKKGSTSIDKLALYHAHDLYYTRQLRKVLLKLLEDEPSVKSVFDHILLPCVELFTEVEYDGIFIDTTHFNEAEKSLRKSLEESQRKLKRWGNINWGSPPQLAKLLFQDLGLPVLETTPTGSPSCSESVIKRIDHPLASDLLKFREAKQQLSFFIEGWKPYFHIVRPPKGEDQVFLHPSFKLHGTVTGRLSCEHPNLQQVPRDPVIRSLISAPPGWVLCEWDLSQIELRIAAELSNESQMLDAFIKGVDVHWLTALRELERGHGMKKLVIETATTAMQSKKALSYSEAIEVLLEIGPDAAVEINKDWKETRKKAKAINFGYLYGMWWKKFKLYARDNYGVSVTDEQAAESREAFFEMYPDLEPWHKKQKRYARKFGYVQSLSGRRRRLPQALLKEDTPRRREAERQAINSPVQSFANELNLMAALQLRREFGRNKVRICGTVHDAVLAWVKIEHVEKVFNRMLQIMRGPELLKTLGVKLSVPIEAEGKVGPWSKGVSLAKWKKDQLQCSK